MPRALIVKSFELEAAHVLPRHGGKCSNLHGHSYRIEIGVEGDIKPLNGDPDEGMVMDFSELKECFQPFYTALDHHTINDQLDVPTAERIAYWLYTQLEDIVVNHWSGPPFNCDLSFVRVHETSTSYAEVRTS